MITVILSGGLGNQMFEYAAGRALSLRHKTSLKTDLYILEKKTRATARNYELTVFNIETATSKSMLNKIAVKGFGFLKSNSIGRTLLHKIGIFRDEKAQNYDLRFADLLNETTLFGYFQNENYFKSISNQLRIDFTFKTPLSAKNDEIRNVIEQNTSVSIHIRRGDYENTNTNLSLLEISYYQRAIEYITTRLENPYFFIFSDGIDWVKENLDLSAFNHLFVDWNKNEDSYIDMQLMSLCKHNIIANSSFSWWGAWLNTNPGKLVIAPDKWYKEDNGVYPNGFLPEQWIVL